MYPSFMRDFPVAKLSDIRLMSIGDTIQISGAVWTGEGKSYLCLFPGEKLEDVEILQMDRGEWEAFIQQTDTMQTEVLSRATDGKLAKIIVRKCERQIDSHTSWKVYARDNFSCRYCGRGAGTPLTVDHLICWEEGGPSTEANLVACCKKCNKTRGNIRYQDWLGHPYYKQVSRGLTPEVRSANERLAETLDGIPLKIHARSR